MKENKLVAISIISMLVFVLGVVIAMTVKDMNDNETMLKCIEITNQVEECKK